jgi:hypothetical protein
LETPLVGLSAAVLGSGAAVDVAGSLGAACAGGWVDEVQPANDSRTAAVSTYLEMDIGFSSVSMRGRL